jgi:hypothetical protein
MANDVSIWVRIRDGFTAGLKRAGAAINRFGAGAVDVFRRVGLAAAGIGAAIAGAAVYFLKAFSAQESAEVRLRAALMSTGQEVDALVAKYKDLANTIQDRTAQGDEETLKLIGLATQYGVTASQMERAVNIQLALSAAGVENTAAMKMAANAVQGNYSALTRYIPQLKTANTEAEKQKALADFTATGLDVQSKMLSTNAGRWAELKGRLGDASEALGSIISDGGGVSGVMAMISEKIKGVTASIQDWASSGGWGRAKDSVREIWIAVRLVFSNIVDYAVGSWRIAAGATQDFVNGVAAGMVNLWRRIQATWINGTENIKALFAAVWHKVTHPMSDFKMPSMKPLLDGFTAIEIESDKMGEAMRDMADDVAANEKKAAEEVAEIWKQAADREAEMTAKRIADEKKASESAVKLARQEMTERAKSFIGLEKIRAAISKAAGMAAERNAKDAIDNAKKAADAALLLNRPEGFAQRMQGFIDRRKEAEASEKENAAIAAREKRILAKQDRGIKIASSDRAFLKDLEAFRAAEAEAKKQAALAEKAEAHLARIVEQNEANLKASGGPR